MKNKTLKQRFRAEYRAFIDAHRRCVNPEIPNWKHYGGRGIKFLFTSFEQFFAELGPRPNGLTLDRIENNGHYEPGNVRWATYSQQTLNQRDHVFTSEGLRALQANGHKTGRKVGRKNAKSGHMARIGRKWGRINGLTGIAPHTLWHVNRGIVNPKCRHCAATLKKAA